MPFAKFLTGVCILLLSLVCLAQPRQMVTSTRKSFTHPKGFSFQYPADWRVENAGEYVQVLPPGLSAEDQTENIRVLTEAVQVDASDPRFTSELDQMAAQIPGFTKVGTIQNYQTKNGTGVRGIWSGTNPTTRQTIHLRLYATTVNRLAIVLFAAGVAAKLDTHETQLRDLAASVGNATAAVSNQASPAPTTTQNNDRSPLAQTWLQKLNGKKLTALSSYNGGGGGGMSSKTEIYLRTNGTFQVRSESSVSVYVEGANGGSSGVKRAAGTWRIYARNAQAILETKYENGQIESSLLEDRNGQTFVNGKRWFVTEQ